MFHLLAEKPGLWFVIATFLPLASFVVLLMAGAKRNFYRRYRGTGSMGDRIYQMLGGDHPPRWPAYVATAAIFLAFCCSLTGFVLFVTDHEAHGHVHEHDHHHHDHDAHHDDKDHNAAAGRWKGSVAWASITTLATESTDPSRAASLKVGFFIDNLSAIMFLMVTFIATLIHLFSIGYMSEELQPTVEDHEIHTDHGHFHRRGRFGRFFMFLSLFCFSMLNLILADNLFQIFVSWELVGVCSFLLIGFYYERTSASNAANKAFITNRVGDAGFIIGLLICWTYLGTLNFEEMFQKVRAPDTIHGKAVELGSQVVKADLKDPKEAGAEKVQLVVKKETESGQYAILFPDHTHFKGAGSTVTAYRDPKPHQHGFIPYWMLVVAGLGIFLGCVGKSAQFPLHVWLPDAMEGPTPVSALIHAATMVAAGVYLVGRCFPLFTPEVTLSIAYVGAITLFVAATTAIVMTDIKKVLAYSTVSQLGYMMLALGVGGWVAGLFHLVTHAFFKALLFLGSGSVIYGCHHQQDMKKMGGLYPKMKITALTMLVGCLAIAGTPLFSGWYSKDGVLANAFGFAMVYKEHFLLFLLPLFTAGLTTFYMFRMWFMTFTGKPGDQHVYDHAHESPWLMTVPLVLLAFFSVVVAWPIYDEHHHRVLPLLDVHASELGQLIHHAQPRSVAADFGGVLEEDGPTPGPAYKSANESPRFQAFLGHGMVGNLALGVVAIGFAFAVVLYYWRRLDPSEGAEQFPAVNRFLHHKWYFDELYSVLLVRPALVAATWARWFDANVIDRIVNGIGSLGVVLAKIHGWTDRYLVDGLVNVIADAFHGLGERLRKVQTGYIRSYVLFLVVAAVAIWVLLTFLMGTPAPAGK